MVVFSFSNVFGPFSKNRNLGKKYVRDNGPDGVLEKKKKKLEKGVRAKTIPVQHALLNHHLSQTTSVQEHPL